MPTRTKRRDHSAYLAARAEVERALGPAQHAYANAVRVLQLSATGGPTYAAIASHAPPSQVVDSLDWTGYTAALQGFTDTLAQETVTAARNAYEQVVPVRKRDTPPITPAVDGLGLSWTARQHAAEAFAQARAGERITAITDTTRQAVNDLVGQALREGWSPDRLAGTIKNTVGMHPRYASAVVNYEQSLTAKGLSDGQIRLQVAGLRDKYLNLRARTIARTEVASAQVDGRQQGWQDAISAGAIGADAEQEVLLGTDPCPICEEIEGDGPVPVGGTFSDGSDGPPFHPNCTCAVALVTDTI